MNVLYTLNKGFEAQLVVSLSSLIENTAENLNVFIIYDGINKKSYQFLKDFENKRVEITFLKAPGISKKLIPDRGAKNQFYRLYIPEIFKKYSNINRVLYLDCDTLITKKGLEDLFKIEMGGYALAATIDPWSFHYKQFFNLEKDTNMFNGGIFLIDFENWKKKNYSEKLKK
ncbi:glycosyltransferase family 8 protein [Liquorilactobacillus vini]|uniref:glycosyltransferase family 8 protein n=1 Tax=Liquorilactobacillus vini TaxID=238015 RepID=UPI0002D5B1CF|nr:glycosyltransferase [Liquorilactobacillus vini]